MRYLAHTTMVIFLAGLFAAGQVLGVGESSEKRSGAAYGEETSGQQITARELSAEQVRQLQEALKESGIDPGPVDGIAGPKTQQAIRDFQQEQGLASTGELDQEVLEALDLDAQEFMGVAPTFGEEEQQQESEPQGRESESIEQQPGRSDSSL